MDTKYTITTGQKEKPSDEAQKHLKNKLSI